MPKKRPRISTQFMRGFSHGLRYSMIVIVRETNRRAIVDILKETHDEDAEIKVAKFPGLKDVRRFLRKPRAKKPPSS